MPSLSSLTSAQLIKAANIKDRIAALEAELNAILGQPTANKTTAKSPKKRHISPAHRAKIVAAQKARWEKVHASKGKIASKAVVAKPAKKKFTMSAAAKAKISAAAKARWAAKKLAKN